MNEPVIPERWKLAYSKWGDISSLDAMVIEELGAAQAKVRELEKERDLFRRRLESSEELRNGLAGLLDKKESLNREQAATIARLTEERNSYKVANETNAETLTKALTRITNLKTQVEKLVAALKRYGVHLLSCNYLKSSYWPCNCGLDAARRGEQK